jgi:Tol biopolymer transport system component
MTPSRWQQVEELYHAALECEPGQRAALLERADRELRRELESLLAQESGATPLDHPAWEGAASLLGSTVVVLTPGTQLGPYKIEGPLGSGGMGEVFRAVDTRLGRAVAIKTSQEQFSERFNREARAISSLNHPHICTLYDVGPNYLVMELCEGETLAARLKHDKLSIDDTLRYGQQIADALAAAYSKGIVHRDLKPGNIMLGKSGVKVLDFGLAKSPQDATLTGTRMVMGTPAYMAPEQRDGQECDARTDIYALGLVLYEMTTGIRAAQERLPVEPAGLERVIKTCLAKDPDGRFQSARDASLALAWIAEPNAAGALVNRPVRRWWIPAVAVTAALAFITGLALALLLRNPAVPEEPTVRFLVSPPEANQSFGFHSISPDGRWLAFTTAAADGTGGQLWVRPLDATVSQPLAAAELGGTPFWSPDSRSIGFVSGGKLVSVDPRGGPSRIICDAPGGFAQGTWGPGGVIVFHTGIRRGLYAVAATGGEAKLVTALDASSPQFLPDGRHLLYFVQSGRTENRGIYIGSLDSAENRLLINTDRNAVYAGSRSGLGHLLFMRGTTLLAQPFDDRRFLLTGEQSPVAEGIATMDLQSIARAAFSASESRMLVYRQGDDAAMRELVWFDRSGRKLGTVGEPADYSNLALAPDETRLALSRTDALTGTRDLWVFELPRATSSRFTFDPGTESNPFWSPDGSQIAFQANPKGPDDIYKKSSRGAGEMEPVLESTENKFPEAWSPDGQFILYFEAGVTWALPLRGDRKPISEFRGSRSEVSPNGRWVAYESPEAGRNEIYVRSFPRSGGKLQVSTAGGSEPHWRKDGKELFYIAGGKLMAVEVKTDASVFEAGARKVLFAMRLGPTGRNRYQVAANGQKFLLNVPLESTLLAPITVVTNWTAGLK